MIALFGGTFDPIHRGHLHAAHAVAVRLQVDVVHLVLSARPSHRDEPGTRLADRWAMLALAVEQEPGLVASDVELHRSGPSYTVDTLIEVAQDAAPEEPLTWVLGWDAYRLLPTWHRWQEILDFAHLLVVRRPGQDAPLDDVMNAFDAAHSTVDLARLHHQRSGQVLHLPAPMMPISATDVRRRIACGEDVSGLLPAAVWTYIKERNLYGGATA